MPFSNWLHHIAVRGCLIAAFALALPLHAEENNPQQQPQAAQPSNAQQQAAQEPPPPSDRKEPVDPDWSKPNCGKPQQHNEADLCQQIRMAEAAERTVTLNQIQVGIGFVGGFLLFWTLFYSRRAALAAGEAATSAEKAANVAEESFRRLERPYLLIRFEHFRGMNPGTQHKPYLACKIVNNGKLPAILRSVSLAALNSPQQPLALSFGIEDKTYYVIEPGGASEKVYQEIIKDSLDGQWFNGANATLIIFHGMLQYEDPTGAFHTDRFCMRGNNGGRSFTIDGGPEYNWRKTEYPPPHDPESMH